MVRSVAAEEAELKLTEERLLESGDTVQVGLVVGKLSTASDRALVYALIPTPLTDDGVPACSLNTGDGGGGGSRGDKKKGPSKGGGKSSKETPPSIVVDGDWIAEHARQISRMLLGGMYVIGIYVRASEGSFKATPTLILAQTIRGVLLAASRRMSDSNEGIVLHFSYSPRRLSCRICASKSGTMRPCDMKMRKLLTSLQLYRCIYNFQLRIPMYQFEAKHDLKKVLCNYIDLHTEELQEAKVLIDGELKMENHSSISEDSHNVELLLPFQKTQSFKACSSEEALGFIVFSGTICAFSYLGPEEPISEAISDLKGDIINSLRNRLDIISDEEENDRGGVSGDGDKEVSEAAPRQKSILCCNYFELRKPFSISFPRRVLVRWLSGVFVCDYLQPSETFEDLKARFMEVMSIKEVALDPSDMLGPETIAAQMTSKSFWDAVHGSSLTSPDGEKNPGRRKADHFKSSSNTSSSRFHSIHLLGVLLAVVGCGIAFFFPGPKG